MLVITFNDFIYYYFIICLAIIDVVFLLLWKVNTTLKLQTRMSDLACRTNNKSTDLEDFLLIVKIKQIK